MHKGIITLSSIIVVGIIGLLVMAMSVNADLRGQLRAIEDAEHCEHVINMHLSSLDDRPATAVTICNEILEAK